MCQFCNLHVHTQFSSLDGLCRIDKTIDYVKNTLDQKAVAITDHGVMHGAYAFYHAAKKAGLIPVIGTEGYLASDSHLRKDSKLDRSSYHILMMACSNEGYQNLVNLTSIAHKDGFYYRPRIDHDLLEKYNDGLIVTSGCLASEISQAIMHDDYQKAEMLVNWYKELLGDRFYFEVQPRFDFPEQEKVNKWIMENYKRFDVKVIATTDAHYISESDYDTHDDILTIQMKIHKGEHNPIKFNENSYYLGTQQHIINVMGNHPFLWNNTQEIAERCNVRIDQFENDKYYIPQYNIPDGYKDNIEFIEMLTYKGLHWRFTSPEPKHFERLEYELSIIKKMGFVDYFLIVWDLCQYARNQNIWWNVRGSGAGSIVSYVLGITELDPLESDLYFERFLNPDRVSMPDIDIDWEDKRREDMVSYTVQRYGSDRVAAITTFGTLGSKAAVKDIARIYQYPAKLADQISKEMKAPGQSHPDIPWFLEHVDPVRELYDNNSDAKTIIDKAAPIEGLIRQTGVHAAGIVISPDHMWHYMPTCNGKKGTSLDLFTQYDMHICEKMGLLKIDYLGLVTLSIMKEA
jgi:DNA polymerase-3 subunit alpha